MNQKGIKREKGIELILSWFKKRLCLKRYKLMKKRARYRLCVIKEILKTENDFVNDVNMVCE